MLLLFLLIVKITLTPSTLHLFLCSNSNTLSSLSNSDCLFNLFFLILPDISIILSLITALVASHSMDGETSPLSLLSKYSSKHCLMSVHLNLFFNCNEFIFEGNDFLSILYKIKVWWSNLWIMFQNNETTKTLRKMCLSKKWNTSFLHQKRFSLILFEWNKNQSENSTPMLDTKLLQVKSKYHSLVQNVFLMTLYSFSSYNRNTL